MRDSDLESVLEASNATDKREILDILGQVTKVSSDFVFIASSCIRVWTCIAVSCGNAMRLASVSLTFLSAQQNPLDSPTLEGVTQFLLKIHDYAVKTESGTRSLIFRLVRHCLNDRNTLQALVSTVSLISNTRSPHSRGTDLYLMIVVA